jgi:hypothetical protein
MTSINQSPVNDKDAETLVIVSFKVLSEHIIEGLRTSTKSVNDSQSLGEEQTTDLPNINTDI